MRSVNCFMTTGSPAGPAANKGGMVTTSDKQLIRSSLQLEVALQAEHLVARLEKLRARGAVRRVADGTAIACSFVFENVGASLGLMALQAGFRFSHRRDAAAHDRRSRVRVMAVVTGNVLANRVRMSEIEGSFDVQVATVAGFRIGLGIMDRADLAT